MNGFFQSLKNELRFIIRTPALLLLVVLAPLGYPFLYSYLYVNKFETKVPVVVVDLDHSASSRLFIRTLDATENIRIDGGFADPAKGRAALESGQATGYILIPKEFGNDLDRTSRPAVRIYIDATRFMPVSNIAQSLADAVCVTSRKLLLTTFEKNGIPREMRMRYADPISLETTVLANTTGSYGDFIIPAILLLILQQTLLAATALSAAGLRRNNRLPGNAAAILGKALPYFILYSLYALLFFTWHYHLWKIPFSGAALTLVPIIGVHLLTTIFIGFFVGSLFKSSVTAMVTCLFTTYPLFLLSGFAWPVSSMSTGIQAVSELLPSTHFIVTVFSAARLNASWSLLQNGFTVLLVSLGISIILLAVQQFSTARIK